MLSTITNNANANCIDKSVTYCILRLTVNTQRHRCEEDNTYNEGVIQGLSNTKDMPDSQSKGDIILLLGLPGLPLRLQQQTTICIS
jgi:hypothetical protein